MDHILSWSQNQLLQADLPGQPFRRKQLYQWFHKNRVLDYSKMTNLPQDLIEYLQNHHPLPQVKLVQQQVAEDGTKKLLFALEDDYAEAVIMEYHYGSSLCLSTQIGCRMGCTFCASTLHGLVRNITASEMLMMFYLANNYSKNRISRLVLMGSGEPLENFDQVMVFLHQIVAEDGYNLSGRHISLSTCGLPDGIRRLAQQELPITLALSLHAPNDNLRRQIMPIAQAFPLNEVLAACDDYIAQTGRRVTIEYAMIEGFNDTPEHARQLIDLIKGKLYHVNLIPVNPIKERSFSAPERKKLVDFQNLLEAGQIRVTIRRELGSEIAASCGQLRNQAIEK